MTKLATTAVVLVVLAVVAATAQASETPAGCGPENLWARACVAATAGTAPLEGAVDATSSFSHSDVALMYRTVEGSLGPQAGTAVYGSWQAVGTGSTGAFRLMLPACSAQAAFGCIGGTYELYGAYNGQPCTEMWYAQMFVGETDRLPANALVCAHVFSTIQPLTGGTNGFDGAACPLAQARNCLPGAYTMTSTQGAVSHPSEDTPFSFSDVLVAYRTIETGLHGETIYGVTHYVRPGMHGNHALAFKVPSCGSQALRRFGCAPQDVETWPEYDHVTCGERFAVKSNTAAWNATCDTRGTIEGELLASSPATWQVTVRKASGTGSTARVSVEPDGAFITKVMPGVYRIEARRNKYLCSKVVGIGIASVDHVRLRCGTSHQRQKAS